MKTFKNLFPVALCMMLAAGTVAAIEVWERVEVTGTRDTELTWAQQYEQLKESLTGAYGLNVNGDIISDDPEVYSGQTDARCNYKTSINSNGTNASSGTAAKTAAASTILTQLKGSTAN